jgi:hypothetical protein
MKHLVYVLLLTIAACGPSSHNGIDGNGAGDSSTADALPFGTECTSAEQCPNGGYCIEGFGGKVCTYPCTQGCPSSWECRATKIDGDLVSVCVPPDFELCLPCSADNQCGDGACSVLGDESYCLPRCPFEGSCPTGYSCGPDPSGTHAGMYCVPTSGSCSCTDASDGTVRTCTSTNAFGTCKGLETCRPNMGGWIGCDAPPASAEVCDGIDNDCNQLIDDGVASGQACQITVPGVGTCPGVTLCTGMSGSICQGATPVAETCNYTDDDCDGMTDEQWPQVNTVCNTGVGACQRFGVIRCDAMGTGTQCSAMPGMPIAELCNGNDDDCDMKTDETFTTKGDLCTVGTGACQRTGNQVCNSSGSALQCSVSPGTGMMEACNSVDDDCDGLIDETFKTNGVYQQDTACGSCAVDCTVLFGVPNASGHCTTSGTPQCFRQCDPGAFDLDGVVANGCEFILDPGAIYVSTSDAAAVDDASCGLGPVGTGPAYHPCKTIAQGIARANITNRPRVLVANGIYAESVTLANGRSVLGAYRPDNWVRDLSSTATLISGVSSAGNHDRTVIASNITSATVFEGFAVLGSVNAKPSGNSYAIYVSGSNANLVIRSNVIFSGRGGPGQKGSDGGDGPGGTDGVGRVADLTLADAAYDSKQATAGSGECDAVNNRQYTNGGATSCGGTNVAGGSGGGNRCPALSRCTAGTNTGCSTFSWNENTAIDGTGGNAGGGGNGGIGGAGGFAGDDMFIYFAGSAGIYCYLPPSDADADPDNPFGLDGANGGNGVNGNAGGGCTTTGGSVVAGNWVGAVAGGGVSGGNGGGGGGGGAGGGGRCDPTSPGGGTPTGCTGGSGTTAYLNGKDKLGPHGGGGGAGGCGGAGGGGASAGGAAFGIFVVGTTPSVITNNTIYRGEGGAGGAGGAGGKGGVGGSGAGGGLDGGVFCTDIAGRGGNGGNGGHGAGGGGGCGGSSFGIYTSGIGAPNYCQAAAMNTYSGGSGGGGGAGGYSIINPGAAGSAGALLDCSFN